MISPSRPGTKPGSDSAKFVQSNMRPPAWLADSAKPFWAELVEQLTTAGLNSSSFATATALCADFMAKYHAAESATDKAKLGGLVTNSIKGLGLCPSMLAKVKLPRDREDATGHDFSRGKGDAYAAMLRKARGEPVDEWAEYVRLQEEALSSRESDESYDAFLREHRGEAAK